jgi:glycosyltransferase involved in cell wall biosynthesis
VIRVTRGRRRIAMVVSGFPRRSETFALNELVALDDAGALVAIFATGPGDGAAPHPDVPRIAPRVVKLPPGSASEQARAVAACLDGADVAGVHGYFAHVPADVAARAAALLDLPFGFSAHARDIRKVEPAELARRGREAAIVIACNGDVAESLGDHGAKAVLVPHGVDLRRFAPCETTKCSGRPLQLLSVGRLVEKKGFLVLLSAVARVALPFALRIVGEGPEAERLQAAIARLGLSGRVTLCGGRTHADLPQEYAAADIVIVPSILDRSGDRDGLPNVMLEAMASARPVIATRIGGLASALEHRLNGWLVGADDPVALADAITLLGADTGLRQRLGRAGRERAERDFALPRCAERLRNVLEAAYA